MEKLIEALFKSNECVRLILKIEDSIYKFCDDRFTFQDYITKFFNAFNKDINTQIRKKRGSGIKSTDKLLKEAKYHDGKNRTVRYITKNAHLLLVEPQILDDFKLIEVLIQGLTEILKRLLPNSDRLRNSVDFCDCPDVQLTVSIEDCVKDQLGYMKNQRFNFEQTWNLLSLYQGVSKVFDDKMDRDWEKEHKIYELKLQNQKKKLKEADIENNSV